MRTAGLDIDRRVRTDTSEGAGGVSTTRSARVVVHADREALAQSGNERLAAGERTCCPATHAVTAVEDGVGDHRHVARAVLEAPRVWIAVAHLRRAVTVLERLLPRGAGADLAAVLVLREEPVEHSLRVDVAETLLSNLSAVGVEVVSAHLADEVAAVPRERDTAHDHVADCVDGIVSACALDLLRGHHVLAVRAPHQDVVGGSRARPLDSTTRCMLGNRGQLLGLPESEQSSCLVPGLEDAAIPNRVNHEVDRLGEQSLQFVPLLADPADYLGEEISDLAEALLECIPCRPNDVLPHGLDASAECVPDGADYGLPHRGEEVTHYAESGLECIPGRPDYVLPGPCDASGQSIPGGLDDRVPDPSEEITDRTEGDLEGVPGGADDVLPRP